MILQNRDKFEPDNPAVIHALNNPSDLVTEIEDQFNLPTKKWLDRADRSPDGTPILRALIDFTDTGDSNELRWYKRFPASMGKEYRITKRNKNGLTLTKTTPTFVLVDGKRERVKVELEVTNKPDAIRKMASDKYFLVSNRGHSGHGVKQWENAGWDSVLGLIGSCNGGSAAPNYQKENPGTIFFGTHKTGKGFINNAMLRNVIKSLGKCEDTGCLWNNILKNQGQDIEEKWGYINPSYYAISKLEIR